MTSESLLQQELIGMFGCASLWSYLGASQFCLLFRSSKYPAPLGDTETSKSEGGVLVWSYPKEQADNLTIRPTCFNDIKNLMRWKWWWVSVVANVRFISQCTGSIKEFRNLPKNVMEPEFKESEWCAVQTEFKLFLQLRVPMWAFGQGNWDKQP